MKHESNIFTNDGWVVTLVSDRPIDFGPAIISSIIVQPTEDYERRVSEDGGGVMRTEYKLSKQCEKVYGSFRSFGARDMVCGLPAGHDGHHDSQPWATDARQGRKGSKQLERW